MQPPAPKPAFISRVLFRIRSELSSKANAPTNKRLYFKSAHLLENRRGETFRLHLKKAYPVSLEEDSGLGNYVFQDAYAIMKAPMPGRGAFMRFVAYAEGDTLEIAQLHSFLSLAGLKPSELGEYTVPNPKMRGYGFLQIAVLLGSHIAKKHGINKLIIMGANDELEDYYMSCGFSLIPYDNRGVLSLPLKTINP
ncbi:hypothetical protein JW721_03730 [Candidatus Micrarchaeota archaeon]|nr:hypothetical protein [Candidatus Micrarchaeota archaeon]